MKTDRYEGQLSAVLLKATAAENITHQYPNTCKKVSKINEKQKQKRKRKRKEKKNCRCCTHSQHNHTQKKTNKNKTLSIVASQLF